MNIYFSATAIITVSTARASCATQNTCRLTWKTDHPIWFDLPEQVWSPKNVDKANIVQVGSRELSVIIHSYNATCYMVSSGNDKNMSYCTCSSWNKSYYPCKNFSLDFWSFQIDLETHYLRCMLIFPISNLTFIEREKCSADGDLSHEPSNGKNTEKEGITLIKHCKEKKTKRVEKKKVVIIWLICRQESLGTYHYHHSVVACCMR